MAATLASLLGINAPTHAVGRVLTEALAGRICQSTPRDLLAKGGRNDAPPKTAASLPWISASVSPESS